MITIHHEKETDFSKNGYGAIDDYVMSQEVTWEMNGQFYAYLEYPAFLDKSAYLVNKNVLRVPVPFMEDQLFRIYRVRKVLGFIQVEARHIFYDLMDNLIEDTNIVGKTGSQALQQLLGATQYEHRFIGLSDISTSNNARMVRYNPVEALLDDSKANTFVSRWGGEIVRDNFVIRMARQMGTDRGVRIQHRKDLTAYIATIDESTVVTRIMPVGFDGLKLPELYIDSPLLDPDNPKIGVIRYENVKAAIGEYADDNGAVPLEEAYELLREHARAEFNTNHLDEPEMTVTVNFVTLHNTKEYADFAQLQEIHQGDVVRVTVPDEDFEVTSRLVAFTSDPLQQNHYTSTTLGNHVYEFTSSTNSVSTLKNEVEALRESVVEVRQSANGKNQSFWGQDDPNTLNLNAILGDTYFRSVGEEDVIYQYVEVDGERYWKEIINTANTSEVKKEVERVAEEAEKLADDITEAYQKADDAKRDAGLALSASEALEIITQETASQLSDTRGLLTTVESNASEAWAKADSALSQAGQAITDAYTAQTTAQSAISQAQSALSKANSVEETTNSLVIDVDNLAGEVSLKADSSTVNTLSGTVSSQGTTLTQQAGLIASKANQSTVDTLSGKVSDHTTTLSQHATAINARLTQSQVDNLVSGKGYSTVSYVDNKISATADGISAELTRVEGKIPTRVGGTNLIVNSKFDKSPFIERHNVNWNIVNQIDPYGKSSKVITLDMTQDQHYFRFRSTKPLETVEYTFSAWLKRIAGSPYPVQIGVGNDTAHGTYAIGDDKWTKVVVTGKAVGRDVYDWAQIRTGNQWVDLYVFEPMLEVGKIASDYMPAPNDLLLENDFTVFKNAYSSTIEGITSELSKTAKTTDLAGMVTEAYLATNQYAKQGEINTQLQSYLKTTDLEGKVQSTSAFQDIKATTDRFTRVIGSTDEQAKANIAQIVMTDSLFQTTIRENVTGGGVNRYKKSTSFHAGAGIQSFSKNNLNGFNVAGGSSSPRQLRMNGVIDSNGWWTISGWFRGIQSININFTIDITDSAYSEPFYAGTANEWQYFEVTRRVVGYSSVYNFIDINLGGWAYYEFKDIMVEKGKIAHDWSPATDDLATSQQLSDVKQTADSIQALVGTTNDSVARAVMTSSLWETEVNSVITGLNTTVSQLAGSWALTLKSGNDVKTQLNATTDGVRIKSSLIHLDGNVTMNNAFARKLMVDNLVASDVTAFAGKFSKVIANSLDVNQLSGNAMSFISGAFTSNSGSLLLSGSGIRVNFNNGYSLRINGAGTNYYTSDGLVVGGLQTAVPSSGTTHTLSLVARKGYTVSMDYQGSLAYNQSNRALSVDGTSGNIAVHRPIYESTSSVGLSFLRSQMGNVGWGLLLTSTRATGSGIFLADNGEVWIGVSGGYKQFT